MLGTRECFGDISATEESVESHRSMGEGPRWRIVVGSLPRRRQAQNERRVGGPEATRFLSPNCASHAARVGKKLPANLRNSGVKFKELAEAILVYCAAFAQGRQADFDNRESRESG